MRGKLGLVSRFVNTDDLFSSVLLLLHFDGANGSTTFTDSSGTQKTTTASGSAQISTAQSRFGGASGFFNGASGTRVDVSDGSANFSFEGDFTIEAWIYPTNVNQTRDIVSRQTNSTDGWRMSVADGSLSFYAGSDNGAFYYDGSVVANQWQHVAVCRSQSEVRMFINGSQVGSASENSGAMTGGSAGTSIGGSNHSSFPNLFAGYIDELRITEAGRYDANFTPATAPFPDA